MIYPQIRCNHSNLMTQPHVFYILCKGENAGKPSLKPWANSFVVICQNQQYFDFYYWLVYGIFKAGKFKVRLRGSVIPFINVDDVRDIIRELAPAIFPDWSRFRELIVTMDKLENLKSNLAQQLIASEILQKQLICFYFKDVHKKVSR